MHDLANAGKTCTGHGIDPRRFSTEFDRIWLFSITTEQQGFFYLDVSVYYSVVISATIYIYLIFRVLNKFQYT